MSKQLRFSGSTLQEAIGKAKATLGEEVQLLSAERISRPGLLRKRVSYTVVGDSPVSELRPVAASAFAGTLQAALAAIPPDAGEGDDFGEVSASLAEIYAAEAAPGTVLERQMPKVLRRNGKIESQGRVRTPRWGAAGEGRSSVWGASTGGRGEAARAVSEIIDSRIDSLVVDITGDSAVIDLRFAGEEVFEVPEAVPLLAVVAQTIDMPLAAFDSIADLCGVSEENRFVLARKRRDIPRQVVAQADAVARAVVSAQERGDLVAVLVDPGQLKLLRSSFLERSMAVSVVLPSDASESELEEEVAACGRVDAIWCRKRSRGIAALGLPELGGSRAGE